MNEVLIGNRIKSRREELDITLEQLAIALGLNKSTIQRYETGQVQRIKIPILQAIAKYLNVNPDWLAAKTDSKTEYATPVHSSPYDFNGVEIHTAQQNALNLWNQSDFTYDKVEDCLGTNYQMFNAWCKGNSNYFNDKIPQIAEFFNVSIGSLVGWFQNEDSQDNSVSNSYYNPILHRIPILGRISAGLPLYAEEHIQGYTYTEHNGGGEYFSLRVSGDSMNAAQINDGNLIIVRKQNVVENGEIAVVRVNSEDATIKRFRQDENIVQLIPQSFNPQHQVQIYDLKKTKIDVIGKVVECKILF